MRTCMLQRWGRTYKTANNDGHSMGLKQRHALDDCLEDQDGAEDADKGPEDGHQVARVHGLRLAVSEEPRDRVRQVWPWRRRYKRIDVAVDVEVPGPVAQHDMFVCRPSGDNGTSRSWQ